MKALKICIAIAALIIAGIGIACEHCDDTDYERDKKESAEVVHFHTDTTQTIVD